MSGIVAEATLLGVCASGAAQPARPGPRRRAARVRGRARLLPAAPAADALHVRGVGSVIVSDDPALLDELVAADALGR